MTFEATPTPLDWAGIDRDMIGPLAEADPFGAAQYLIELMPKASAKQLASELERLGAPRLTKREASEWREMILRGEAPKRRRPAEEADDEPKVDAPTARSRLKTAIEQGDAAGALRWSRVVMALHDTATPDGAQDEGLDFERLTDVQLSAYRALIGIARGEDLDPEGVWWRTLFGRVPGQRAELHPAHTPLPDGTPIPARLTPAAK